MKNIILWFNGKAIHLALYQPGFKLMDLKRIYNPREETLKMYSLTICDLLDCSPPGSSVHGILQARIPDWVDPSFSRGTSRPKDRTLISGICGTGRQTLHHCCCGEVVPSCVQLFATPWTVGCKESDTTKQLMVHQCLLVPLACVFSQQLPQITFLSLLSRIIAMCPITFSHLFMLYRLELNF